MSGDAHRRRILRQLRTSGIPQEILGNTHTHGQIEHAIRKIERMPGRMGEQRTIQRQLKEHLQRIQQLMQKHPGIGTDEAVHYLTARKLEAIRLAQEHPKWTKERIQEELGYDLHPLQLRILRNYKAKFRVYEEKGELENEINQKTLITDFALQQIPTHGKYAYTMTLEKLKKIIIWELQRGIRKGKTGLNARLFANLLGGLRKNRFFIQRLLDYHQEG